MLNKFSISNFCKFFSFLRSLLILLFAVSCSNTNNNNKEETSNTHKTQVSNAPVFNPDSAYFFIQQQVNFGPRVTNTAAHDSCADFLINKLKAYTENVIIQNAKVEAFNGKILSIKNIIASFNPDMSKRIMLCAHWDTRPFADQDVTDQAKPIDGANDGASGVGVLLEIARNLIAAEITYGIDIILFDAEDYGPPDNSNFSSNPDSWCLGSQYWAKNLHQKNYFPYYAILLDMVGASNAVFTMEGNSMKFSPSAVKNVWETAAQLGYSDYFSFEKTKAIVDDHVYINTLAGIPCIDIIQYDKNTESNFGSFWHTHQDKIDIIDKKTLKVVGQTILEVIFQEAV